MRWTPGVVAVVLATVTALPAAAQETPPGRADEVVASGPADLAADDPAVRRSAAAALGSRWPEGARGVAALLELLDDEDASVSRAAAESLAELGRRSVPALAALVASASEAGPADVRVLDELVTRVQMLGHAVTPHDFADGTLAAADPAARRAGLLVLASASGSFDRVLLQEIGVGRLSDPGSFASWAAPLALHGWAAARASGRLPVGPPVEVPEAWLAAVRSDVPALRWVGAKLITRFGRSGPRTHAALRAALLADARRSAAVYDERAAAAVAEATGAAGDPVAADPAAVHALFAEGRDQSGWLAAGYCRHAAAADVVPWLDAPAGRNVAAHRIACSPTTPVAAEPGLRRVLTGAESVDAAAALALSRVRTADPDVLRETLAHMDRAFRTRDVWSATVAACAAAWLAGPTPERTAHLDRAVAADERSALDAVVALVRQFGAPAVPFLRRFAPDAAGRAHGWQLLAAAHGPDARALVPDLAARLPGRSDAQGAADASGDPGPQAEAEFIAARDRVVSLRALAAVGPAASSVLPVVDALRGDPDLRIQVLAGRASRAIRAK